MKILRTALFDSWLRKLKDKKARAIIQVNINRLIEGQFGKVRSLGEAVYEKKIDYGPGYRLYFINHDQSVIVLLCAGDKSTQKDDIKRAKAISSEVKIELKGSA